MKITTGDRYIIYMYRFFFHEEIRITIANVTFFFSFLSLAYVQERKTECWIQDS